MTPTKSAPTPRLSGESVTDAAATLLPAVAELARIAGDIALGHFDHARRSRLPVEYKADGSPVTIADRTAEASARDSVDRHFPKDGFLGEESGAVRSDARRRWIVDPIDGTKSFVRGVPLWGTLVAVAEGGDGSRGRDQLRGSRRRWWWRRWDRAVGGMALGASVSTEHQLAARAAVLATDERFPQVSIEAGASEVARRQEQDHQWNGWRRVAERAAIARSWGDCFGYLLVATGRAEVMVDAIMATWDTAALWPVVTEAGGVFTDWAGAATAFGGSSVATNAVLATEVRALLNPAGRAGSG